MKQCIICDNIILDQREEYKDNHYLCGETCAKYYSYIAFYDVGLKRFDIGEYTLNEIRREIIGIGSIDENEINKRID